MESYLILDGYNLLGALERYRGEGEPLAERRERLVRDALKAAGWTGAIIIVVFDAPHSPAPGTSEVHAGGAVRVIYTAPGETADDQIERLVDRLTGDVKVYTADFAQQRTVLARGGTRATPAEFAELLDELPALIQTPKKRWRSRVGDYMSQETRRAFEDIRRRPEGG
jgi:predicted RNA-binding protein with PIN domain